MSGEAGGAVVGGVLLIAALPYILAGVAIAGCAAGTVALGSAAVKAGVRHHKRNKQLKAEQCSQELSELYGRMQAALERQDRLSEQYYRTVEQQMDQLSRRLRQETEGQDAERLEERIRQAKRESAEAIGAARVRELNRIQRETQAELTQIRSNLDSMQKTKLELLDWQAGTAAAKAQQEALARDILRDAEATIRLLQSLASSSRDKGFREQVGAMERSYRTAADALEAGALQQAVAGGQRIISRGASLALEHTQKQRETDEVLAALRAWLERLKAELETQRMVSFEDELYGSVEEDLNDFTQGEYSAVQKRIETLLKRVHGEEEQEQDGAQAGETTLTLLEQLLEQVENELAPYADRVVRTGMEKLMSYYERLHALQAISGYMREQGYQVSWVQPAGGDVTQELAVQFLEPVSGNTVSVSLDEDADAKDIGRMAMEVMFYYQNGRPLTESEKEDVRKGMLGSLRCKGLDGALSCTGSVGKPAENKRLETAQSVENIQPRPVFLERIAQD